MNYYQFHIADWALHTSHLTVEEEGVYRRLLDYYYDTESPIPEKTQPVIRRLRLGSYTETVGLILDEFFTLEADGWHNSRADKELKAYHAKADLARANGKKGGRPKKTPTSQAAKTGSKNPEETKPVISGLQKKSESKANQEPITNNQEPITNTKTLDQSAIDRESLDWCFEQFWSAGMRKVGRKKAQPLFEKIIKKQFKPDGPTVFDLTNQLVTDIRNRLAAGQLGFAEMHPTTYLNGERWNDEISTPQQPAGPRAMSAVDRVKQGVAERQRAREREASQLRDVGGCVVAEAGSDVRVQVHESVWGESRQHLGEVLDGN